MIKITKNIVFTTILAVTMLTGCATDEFTIELPQQNQTYLDELPNTLRIAYVNSAPNIVMLNGVDITEHFQEEGGYFVAQGSTVDGFFNQGNNVLSVEPGKFGPKRAFFLDTQGPKISITEVELNGMAFIQGELSDPSGVSDLTINGVVVSVNENSGFTGEVAASDMYHLVAFDSDGRQSESFYSDRNSIVEDAIKIRVDETAIHDMLPVAQTAIADMDINTLLQQSGNSTLFSEQVGIYLPKVVLVPQICSPKICTFGICTPQVCTPEVSVGPINIDLLALEASLVDVDVAEVNVDRLDIESGNHWAIGDWEGVSFDGEILDAHLGIQIKSYVLGLTDIATTILDVLGLSSLLDPMDGNFTVYTDVSRLRAAADVAISAVDGAVDATIVSVNAIGLGDLDSDFTIDVTLPDVFNVFGLGLAQTMVDVITGGIEGAKNLIFDLIFGQLLPPLADVIVDSVVNEIRVNVAVGITNGAQLSTLIEVSDIDVINDSNSLVLYLNGRIGAEEGGMAPGEVETGTDFGSPEVVWVDDHFMPDQNEIPDNLGPAPGVAPTALGFRFTPGLIREVSNDDTEIALVAATNYINQGMLALYESGISIVKLPLIIGKNSILLATEETATHRVVNYPSSPFELAYRGSANKVPYLIINNFHIVTQEKTASGDWNQVKDAMFSAELPISIHIDEGHLELAFLTPSLTFESSDANNLLVQYILSTIVIEQVNLGIAQIPLPLMTDVTYGEETLVIDPQGIDVSDSSGIGVTANTH